MKRARYTDSSYYLLGYLVAGCTQSYNPLAIKGNYQYLVVDGIIRNGPDSTIFKLIQQ